MTNDLAAPAALTEFPGAPFTDALVDAAVGDLRDAVGWHIAPSLVADVVELDPTGGPWLFLPSLYVTAVTLVEDITGDVPVPITDYKVKRNGRLYRAGGWPAGVSTVRVTMTHGHTTTPPELYAVIAARCQFLRVNGAVEQESAGQLAVRYRSESDGDGTSDPTVERFRLRGFG